MKRFPASAQVKLLREFGVPERGLYEVSKKTGVTVADVVASLRRGDVLVVTQGHLLVPAKSRTNDKPRSMFWKTLRAIEARGASAYDLAKRWHTAIPEQRDLFVQEVIERLASAARGHSGAKNGLKGGRKPRDISGEVEAARIAWFDLRNKSVKAAIAAGPPGWSKDRYYDEFGPRGGRD
jgi:hypothetical protein